MRINQTITESGHNASFNGIGAAGAGDMQSSSASGIGDDMDIRRIMINDCSTGLQDTHNSQLGCTGIEGGAAAAVTAVAAPTAAAFVGGPTNTADYMSDAFGQLCLNSLACANGTAGDAFSAGTDQNTTHLLLDANGHSLMDDGEDSFVNYCMNRAGNISYLNISCEFELEYATPLYGFCIPILLFVTVTANLLIVIVLSRRSMATPTNSVLMGESSAIIMIIRITKNYEGISTRRRGFW